MDRFAVGAALSALCDGPQHGRLLTLNFPRGDGPAEAFMVANKLHAREALSRGFRFVVDVLSDDARIPLKKVMGKMATVALVREDGSLRYFNGYVTQFRLVKAEGGFAHYTMVLEPWLAFARLRKNSMSFLGKSVIDLTEATFEQYIQRDWRTRLYGNYPRLTCANQYNESDYNHLHRRWEEHGLHYWYEHRADGHTLWIGDNTTLSDPIDAATGFANAQEIPFRSESGAGEDDAINEWQAVRTLSAGTLTLSSFDYKNPRAQRANRLSQNQQGDVRRYELFEDTGAYGFKNMDDGEAQAQLRMEELDARGQYFEAKGNDRFAQPGRSFILSEHFSGQPRPYVRGEPTPPAIAGRDYLILSVLHTASNNYHNGERAESKYSNSLTCMRKSIRWRPGRGLHSATPTFPGVQTAIVVGPPGQEIHTDEFGRIKVQFHWDRVGKYDDKSSAWVRVMTGWAGNRFGQISLPRVGQEVVVQFLDGNVDHPIVIGSVYNRDNMPPWQLPANKTQSGILTRSSQDGRAANANTLRFEDLKGKEQLWLHAEKDQLIEVEHDEKHWVGHDRVKKIDHDETVEVGNDRTETVGHDEKITIHNNRSERVDSNEKISVGGMRDEDVGKDEHVAIGGNRSVTIGGVKSERVAMAKEETIGLGKALTIGALYQTSVGGAMNTTVALAQSEQVGMSKSVLVGDSSSLTAAKEHRMVVGTSVITMTPNRITIEADEILILGRNKVEIRGDDIDNNPG
jgi:type VI secretion system secreted protein VgrG